MKRIFFGTVPWVESETSRPDPFGSDDEIVIESIVDVPKVRLLLQSFLTHILKHPKYEDPMDLLLEYLAKVSVSGLLCHINSIANCVACTTLRYGPCSRQ